MYQVVVRRFEDGPLVAYSFQVFEDERKAEHFKTMWLKDKLIPEYGANVYAYLNELELR